MQPRQRLNTVESRLASQVAAQVRKALTSILSPGEGADRAPVVVDRAEHATAPAQLAAVHPGGDAARKQILSVYEDCLAHYRDEVRPHDETTDDVGAALAAFVSACMAAVHGIRSAPPCRPEMERQMSGVLRRHPVWVRASTAERQTLFERFAILAVFVHGCAVRAVREGPKAVANVRQAARSYLQELFGIDPKMLALRPDGLHVRQD